MYKRQHLNVVLNLILRAFNLQWNERLGLSYFYNLHNGEIMFNLTKDIKDVFRFLGLNSEDYLNDAYLMNNFIEIVSKCKYVHIPTIFNSEPLNTPSLERFRQEFLKTLRFVIENQSIPFVERVDNNFYPFKDTNRFIHRLDKFFNKKGSLIKSISKLEKFKDSQEKAFIKNKFNGKLVMSWVPELARYKRFGEVLNGFKTYIEREKDTIFQSYVKATPGKDIRIDFIDWYNTEIKALDNEFNRLPI